MFPIKIDDAKELFYGDRNISNKHFIQKHLEPAINKITKLTDLVITYEKVADKNDKRKISSLKFTIKKNDCILDENNNFISVYKNDEQREEPLDDPEYAEQYEKQWEESINN